MHWYIPLIIGILLIATGVYVFTVPLETYLTLSVLFSISFIIKGLMDIFFSIRNHKILQGWGWYLVGGLLSLAGGIILFIYPVISITILPFVVGFTLLFLSFLLMGYSFEMKSLGILRWGNAAILSTFGVIFSFMLIVSPLISGISLVVITGLSFIFIGVSSIALSFDLRTPLFIGDLVLVDGGVVNNIPIKNAVRTENDVLIAVYVNADVPIHHINIPDKRKKQNLYIQKINEFRKILKNSIPPEQGKKFHYFNLLNDTMAAMTN